MKCKCGANEMLITVQVNTEARQGQARGAGQRGRPEAGQGQLRGRSEAEERYREQSIVRA